MDFLTFMSAPFAACLVLVGIHAYMGIHVLRREVIFVDLSLAQIAALGTTIGFLAGFELHGQVSYVFSLVATFIGAGLFSLTRTRRAVIPQEAIIGIVYAVSAAAGILAVDRAPHGAEHIKQMLVGSILWVSWADVAKTAAIYAAVGAFHWVFRERFLTISFDSRKAEQAGWSIRFWDFLFYASFGFVVTSSVEIAGVLLVFAFLIVPSVCAALFVTTIRRRLLFGWAVGFIASAGGCTLSYLADLPTGATVVCVFGGVLILLAALRTAFRSRVPA